MSEEIILGQGNTIVSDIFADDGSWIGIAFSEFKCAVGETVDTGAVTVEDLDPLVTIKADHPMSLDMVIAACQRAKEKYNHWPTESA